MTQRTLIWLAFVAVLGCSQEQPKQPAPAVPKPPKILVAKPSPALTFPGDRPGQSGDVVLPRNVRLKLVWCPPGKFTMGSPKSEVSRDEDEAQVAVTLKHGFWLGQIEVTQGQWIALMETRPWSESVLFPENVREGRDFAATHVNWGEAKAFCGKLTQQERLAGRLPDDWEYTLPTEAQWEYACRAGTTTMFHFGDNETELGQYAWYSKSATDIGEPYAHQVGRKQPNQFGLYDMHGNVWEWCLDRFGKQLPGGADPYNTVGSNQVTRGGSWCFKAGACRSSFRDLSDPSYRLDDQGFRVAAIRSVARPLP